MHHINHFCEGTVPKQPGTMLLPLETLRFPDAPRWTNWFRK